MKVLAKILTYFLAVVLLGALLAPPLYWATLGLASRCDPAGPLGNVLDFLTHTPFQKFYNRAALFCALALLWPTVRWLGMRSWRDLGIEPDPRWLRRLGVGFAVAALTVALMAAAYVALDFYHFRKTLPWGKLPKLALSAAVVALLEETLFRGALLGLLKKSLKPAWALFWLSALFAFLHFLKPGPYSLDPNVTWSSGLALIPALFDGFAQPQLVLAGFGTLFTLGWVLGWATLRTRSLWMSIGFHAGVVFVKMGFSSFTKRDALSLPWVGAQLQIGLVPMAALALGGGLLWLWLRMEKPPSPRSGSLSDG